MPGICFWVFPCFSYRWLGSCLTMPDIHFGFLSRWYESGQNRWVGHGEWQKPNLDCCKQGEAFQKKNISQDHHAAEPLGTVGTQKLQEQGAISNRIPSFLLTYSLSLEPALFCESKYGWGQPCILCLIFYFIAASEEFIQTLALSLNISVASLSLSADQQCHIRTLLFPKRMTGREWWCWRKGIKTTGSHSVRTVLDFTAGVCNPALEFARAFFCWGQH